jgi:hypothetical protein
MATGMLLRAVLRVLQELARRITGNGRFVSHEARIMGQAQVDARLDTRRVRAKGSSGLQLSGREARAGMNEWGQCMTCANALFPTIKRLRTAF